LHCWACTPGRKFRPYLQVWKPCMLPPALMDSSGSKSEDDPDTFGYIPANRDYGWRT
jgi:hypothetical protein